MTSLPPPSPSHDRINKEGRSYIVNWAFIDFDHLVERLVLIVSYQGISDTQRNKQEGHITISMRTMKVIKIKRIES